MAFNTNHPIPCYFYPNNYLNSIRHQQSCIRQSKSPSMKTLNLIFKEINPSFKRIMHHHKIEDDYDRQPTIFIRRQRAALESLLPSQRPSDMHEIFGNRVEVNILPHSVTKTKLSKKVPSYDKSAKQLKTIKHNVKSQKLAHPLQIPIWTPLFPEKEEIYSKVVPFKIPSMKYSHDKQLQREKLSLNSKSNLLPEISTSSTLAISDLETFKVSTVKDLFDEWETLESTVTTQSDSDESLIVHCDSPPLILNSILDTPKHTYITYPTVETNQRLLPSISMNNNSGVKRSKTLNSRQQVYSNLLPPVFEDTDYEETFDKFS